MTPRKKTNARKTRDYILPKEVDRLLDAAESNGRHGHRNHTLILLCYRHGLRVGELMNLRWRNVDFKRKVLRVSRALGGINSVHPLSTIELRALRKLKKNYPGTPYLFVNDRKKTLSKRAASRIVSEAGDNAGLRLHVNPAMLRRGCIYALANAGHNVVALQHYVGHRNIRHTLRYMELPSRPFKDFWK